MHDNIQHLDLTFPTIPVGGREAIPSLRRLLYKHGGTFRADKADDAINEGLLGDIQGDRVSLVCSIHEFINANLAGGGSPESARKTISNVVYFFSWADAVDAPLSMSEVERTFLAWTSHLVQQVRVTKTMNQLSAYGLARLVGQALDGALGRATPLIGAARLRRPATRKTPKGAKADKQNLHATFLFGHLLQDICDGTSLSLIRDRCHISIPLQQGGQIEFKSNTYNARHGQAVNHSFHKAMINLRISAELLLFIGQTGMNLAQAAKIELRRFSFSSDINGYKIRDYKQRRKGEVLFEIFSEYRSHFERYLEWRRELFPNTETRIFPIIRRSGVRDDQKFGFSSVKSACKRAGVVWMPPSALRGSRVNWLLRRTGDPELTAEMAQHHVQTLLSVYETPSQQRALSEVTRFHLRNDPALADKAFLLAVAPGECTGIPKTSATKPDAAPEADCIRPSGCLWCNHHRDIDSLDHVWSLACFRHLKILELGQVLPTKTANKYTHPAEHTIKRLSDKLFWFRESNVKRHEWVEESLKRVEEGHYHDQWSYLIEAVEGASK